MDDLGRGLPLAPPAASPGPTARTIPWVPVLSATIATGVALVWLLLWVLVTIAVLTDRTAWPDGVTVIEPSSTEVVLAVARHVAGPVLAVVLATITWHAAFRGTARTCWVAGMATVCVGLGPVVL